MCMCSKEEELGSTKTYGIYVFDWEIQRSLSSSFPEGLIGGLKERKATGALSYSMHKHQPPTDVHLSTDTWLHEMVYKSIGRAEYLPPVATNEDSLGNESMFFRLWLETLVMVRSTMEIWLDPWELTHNVDSVLLLGERCLISQHKLIRGYTLVARTCENFSKKTSVGSHRNEVKCEFMYGKKVSFAYVSSIEIMYLIVATWYYHICGKVNY